MSRPLFGIIGAILMFAPERVIQMFEHASITNSDEIQRSPSSIPAARAEGLMFLLITTIGGKSYFGMMKLFGVGGALALLFPKQTMEFSAKVTYKNPDEIQWNPTFFDVVRGLGLLYIALAIHAYRRTRGDRTSSNYLPD